MGSTEIMRKTTRIAAALALVMAAGIACAPIDKPAPGANVADYPGHPVTVAAITPEDYAARVQALSDDRFGGRGPGTKDGEAAATWIAEEMKRIGLEPGNNGSYFQTVASVAIELDQSASSFEIEGPKGSRRLKAGDDVAFWTPRFDSTSQAIKGSDLVFVGYGVNAPEYGWNDFEGIDVKGKTIVLFINDPGFITNDATLFKGRAMTYYGRWTYKFEEAARRGAAAVIIVHETEPAAYGWQVVRNSNTGAKYYLDGPDGNTSRAIVHAWITTEVAKDLFTSAGLSYDELRMAANKRGFKAVPMTGLKLNARTVSSVAKLSTRNVIGVLKGRVKPEEHVLYMGHWDHIGVKQDVPGADKIHNGAVDNASGIAAILEMAEAFAKAPKKPRRSIMVAAVTLEEQGLLGSEYLARNPVVPLNRIVAGLNFDGMGPAGPSRDMTVVGSGASELENILRRVLKKQGRYMSPDAEPEKGFFYRSDHISLAKVGVPMLYAGAGADLVEGGREAGLALRQDYGKNRYHQPSDEFDPKWDLRGPVQTMQTMHEVGGRIANSKMWPKWYRGNEFRSIRERSLRSRN
ncbi:MAG: M28 family metallopeptidase [Alphaproteobacteria bacterium]|jgi:Zn-dependent M28 family amino/carboxypeptidase